MQTEPSSPDRSRWIAAQPGVSVVFGLLGSILLGYPERAWLERLIEQDLFDEVPFAQDQPDVRTALSLLQPWNEAHRGGLTEESLDELRADYTRLFIGPSHVLAPPWESVHRSVDKLLYQEQTIQVREWYRRFGLEAANTGHQPDDHLGLELALLSHLGAMAASTLEQGDEDALGRALDAERSFLTEHPVNWVPAWTEMVVTHAHTEFYRAIALLTRGAILELATILGVAVPEPEADQQ